MRVSIVLLALLSFAAVGGCTSEPAPYFGSSRWDVVDDASGADATADADAEADLGGGRDAAPDTAVADVLPDTSTQDVASDVLADVVPDVPTRPTVAIATFNVRRFFDTVCDSGSCGGGAFESTPSEAQMNFRAGQVADAIEAMDVDIALLQEIETLDGLEAIVAKLEGGATAYVLGEIGQPGSLDVAVIARRGTLVDVQEHRDTSIFRPDGSRTTFARELLEVHLSLGGTRVIVLSAHFKSKNNDDLGRRRAEAGAAGDIVRDLVGEHPNALIVLGGDLNDAPGSAAIADLEAGGGLERVAAVLGDDDWTHRFDGVESAIDHLYLASGAAGRTLEGSVSVHRDASGGFGGSDHAALRATFELE